MTPGVRGVSQIILVLIAVVMIVGGGYVLFSEAGSSAGMSRFVVSSILVIMLGLYLLWDAFLP
jgi:hypothetical protein